MVDGGEGKRKEAERLVSRRVYVWLSLVVVLASGGMGSAEERATMVFAGGHDTNTVAYMTRYYEALELVQDKRYDAAMPKLEALIAEDPTWAAAWEALGWSYWFTDRKPEAIALWKRLVTVDARQPLPYTLLAVAATDAGQLPEAIALYRTALSLKPDQAFEDRLFDTRLALARVLLWNGDTADAIRELRALLAQDAGRTDAMLELARALVTAGDHAGALPHWTSLRTLAPDNAEYVMSEALCLLQTGRADDAIRAAGETLRQDPANRLALAILCDATQFGERPADALPHLRRLLDLQEDPVERDKTRVRLIRLIVSLHKRGMTGASTAEAVALGRQRIEECGETLDSLLLLGELLLLDRQYEAAETYFLKVVNERNPANLRARHGLFEVNLALRRFGKAREQMPYFEAFNPRDFALAYYTARLESTRGDLFRAEEALRKLEQAGLGGAVPVLLYPRLNRGGFLEDCMSAGQFREHMMALAAAGFRFVSPGELAARFAQPDGSDGGNPDRPAFDAVVVTFDGADLETVRIATEVAKEVGGRFVLHLPAENADSGLVRGKWNELKRSLAPGQWSVGSGLNEATALVEIGDRSEPAPLLANRISTEAADALETEADYSARVAREFEDSRLMIAQRLDSPPPDSVAYPLGDIGQRSYCNSESARAVILAAASSDFVAGFLQGGFGYAVRGDNLLLCTRLPVERGMSVEDLLDEVKANHPTFLARSLRAQYAAFQGKHVLAAATIKSLRDDGYPPRRLETLERDVRDRLARRIAAPASEFADATEPLRLETRHPFAGIRAETFRDNQSRQYHRLSGAAGLNVTRGAVAEGQAGVGSFRQRVTTAYNPVTRADIEYDERFAGARLNYTFPGGSYLAGEAVSRAFTAKDGDSGDRTETGGSVELQVRPWVPLDVMLRVARDAEPSALAIREGITYDEALAMGVFRLRDEWDVTGSGLRFRYSDDNNRDQLNLATSWLLHERTGFRLGLRYSYVSADEASQAYWSPYKLNRYYIEAAFRGNYLRTDYYNLSVRAGVGRAEVRPSARRAYEEDVQRASQLRYDPGDPPKEDWESVFSLSASLNKPLSKRWSINGDAAYNEAPDYNEFKIGGALKYRY